MTASDYFNIFAAEFSPLAGASFDEAQSRVLYEDSGGHVRVMATRFPNGGKFTFSPSGYEEVFYVAAGSGTRTLPSGETLRMSTGDLVYVQPGVDVEYVLDPGYADVALFWSDTPLDPGLVAGLPVEVDTR